MKEQTKQNKQDLLQRAYNYMKRAGYQVLKTNKQTFKLNTKAGLKIIRASLTTPRKEPDSINGAALSVFNNEIEIWIDKVIIELNESGTIRIIDADQMINSVYIDEYGEITKIGDNERLINYLPNTLINK